MSHDPTSLPPDASYPPADRLLLAVDLGLRTGLALFGPDGRVRWYRSQSYPNAGRLRRSAHGLLRALPNLEWLFLEGGGPLARLWEREARARGVPVRRVQADDWRGRLLYPRERRDADSAKSGADALARLVIAWSGAPRPTSLRHDAAEAVLVGLWAAIEVGWLPGVPPEVRR